MIKADLTAQCHLAALKLTVQQLVNEDKVILYCLFVKLDKIPLAELYQPVEKLEDEGGIGVALGDGHEVDVLMFDMTECRAS